MFFFTYHSVFVFVGPSLLWAMALLVFATSRSKAQPPRRGQGGLEAVLDLQSENIEAFSADVDDDVPGVGDDRNDRGTDVSSGGSGGDGSDERLEYPSKRRLPSGGGFLPAHRRGPKMRQGKLAQYQ